MAATERFCITALLMAAAGAATATVLPDDRADLLYHVYDGGGLTVDGPAVLVRKSFRDQVSVWGHYYVDRVSSASIDVVTTASRYSEQRTEWGLGFDYLRDRTIISASYTNSEENDYSANIVYFGISQDFFGDLTTLAVSYARGWDEVRRNGDDTFAETIDTQKFGISLSQVLTRKLIVGLTYEGIVNEGYLNNPYRQVRYLDPESGRGYSWELEVYPETRNSSAVAVRSLYHLPYRAALRTEYRWFSDSWGINAWNAEVGYVHPLGRGFTIDLRYRYYDQSAADFYADLFPRADAQNFRARNKELSTFNSHTAGAGITYDFGVSRLPWFSRGEVSLYVDRIEFAYSDFLDARVTDTAPGTEPEYGFTAWVTRAFVALWF